MSLLVCGHGGYTQSQQGGEKLYWKQTARVQVKYALDHCSRLPHPTSPVQITNYSDLKKMLDRKQSQLAQKFRSQFFCSCSRPMRETQIHFFHNNCTIEKGSDINSPGTEIIFGTIFFLDRTVI